MIITVIIPTFNRATMLPCSIHSILRQSRSADEILIVDDGSEDDTENVCSRYAQHVTYFKKTNGGKSSALNLGLKHAHGDIIYVLDDDDVALRHTLDRHEKALTSSPEAAFSYGPMLHGYIDPNGSLKVDRQPRLASYPPENFYVHQMVASDIVQPCFAFRRTAAEAIGGYDESFFRSQDYDFILRLASRYPGVRIHNPVFIQRQHCGVRGPIFSQIPYAAIRSHWRKYDRMAVAKQLDNNATQTRAFKTNSDSVSPTPVRESILQKAVIEFRCGRISQARSTIKSAFRYDTTHPITVQERVFSDLLFNSSSANAVLLRSPLIMLAFPWAFRRPIGYDALTIAAKRMRWRALADLRRKRLYDGIIGVAFGCYLTFYLTLVKVIDGRRS